jgi:uncharacterized protein YukE
MSGIHTRGDDSVAFEEGLKPWKSETSSYESMMQVLKNRLKNISAAFDAACGCIQYAEMFFGP